MKIVRKIEDINEDCWCRLTKENFEAIKKLGIRLTYNTFEEYSNELNFTEDDIFDIYIYNNEILAFWAGDYLEGRAPEIKFELEGKNIESDIDNKANFNDLISQREETINQINILENKLKEINLELNSRY